jgi:hypothetical protein
MSLASILSTIEMHIKEYETAIANSLANHHNLLGGLAALQRTLGVVSPIIESLVPSIAPVSNVVDEVITDIESLGTTGATGPAEAPAAS